MTETPKALQPGFPFTWVNRLDPLRKQLIPINAASAMKLAERLTGLSDWGDGDFLDRVHDTIDGIDRVDLSTTGRFGIRYVLNWQLTNKLRVVDAAKRHPELAEVPIKRPIVITGFFRTGTTLLHSVLAADPSNRVGRAWELIYPVGRRGDPFGDVPWRRRQAAITFGLNHAFIPDQEVAHHVMSDSFDVPTRRARLRHRGLRAHGRTGPGEARGLLRMFQGLNALLVVVSRRALDVGGIGVRRVGHACTSLRR